MTEKYFHNAPEVSMTEQSFVEGLALHGADISQWPPYTQVAAEAFSATDAGQRLLLEDRALETVLAQVRTEDGLPVGADFLARLNRIPVTEAQRARGGIKSWLVDVFMPDLAVFKPVTIFSQAAVFALFLGLGVAAGASGLMPPNEQADEVDISDGWFALTLEIDDSDDGLEG